MHTKRIIPCLDVNKGRVVKGVNFVDLKDAGDPVEVAAMYDKSGADELVFLEVSGELPVLDQRDDGWVVAQKGHHASQHCHSGQIVERTHDGTKEFLQQGHHAEFAEHLAQSACDDAHAHEIEHGVEQQAVGCLHDGIEHIGQSHHRGQVAEEQKEHNQTGYSLRNPYVRSFHI